MQTMVPLYGFGGGSGGTGATLTVTAPAGATVTVSKDGKSKTKVADLDGVAVFKGLSSGDWLLSITDGTQTAQKTVTITADYSVTIRYEIDLINDNDTTGGWSIGYKQNSTPAITTEVNKITVTSDSTDPSQANICTAVTKNLIDLSGSTKITVNVTSVKILNAGEIRIGLVKNRTSSRLVSSVKITENKEYRLSITPGSYYVAIYVKGDIDGAEVTESSYVTVDKLVAS